MKLYKTTLTPISNFATTIKGDTLFGQLCWVIRYTFGNERLNTLLSTYEFSPFLVVSDGFAAGFVPKPSLPSSLLGEDSDKKKENRQKIWLTLEQLQDGDFIHAIDNKKANNHTTKSAVVKNSINYKTFTTDDSGAFAPYSESEISLSPKDIYLLLDESQMSSDELMQVLHRLSLMGYGKNTSIGKGFFEITPLQAVESKSTNSNTYMTLSPSSLQNQPLKHSFYEPFTRFGKHGADLANTNPFKKPLLLANTSAVVVFESQHQKQYIGKAIKGHSAHQETVHQGYAILIQLKELNHEYL